MLKNKLIMKSQRNSHLSRVTSHEQHWENKTFKIKQSIVDKSLRRFPKCTPRFEQKMSLFNLAQ